MVLAKKQKSSNGAKKKEHVSSVTKTSEEIDKQKTKAKAKVIGNYVRKSDASHSVKRKANKVIPSTIDSSSSSNKEGSAVVNKGNKSKEKNTTKPKSKSNTNKNVKSKHNKKELSTLHSDFTNRDEKEEVVHDQAIYDNDGDDDDLTFDDIESNSEEDNDDDKSSDNEDEDDFEVKAEKFRLEMLAQQQLADAEERDDATKRVAKTHLLKSVYASTDDNRNGGNDDRNSTAAMNNVGEIDKSQINHEQEEQGDGAGSHEQSALLMQTNSAEELRDRIQETLRVLSNFKDEREEERSRSEYLELLRSDLKQLYEYNDFLLEAILLLFPPSEAVEFMEAMEATRPTTIRVNTLKCKRRDLVQSLTKREMHLEPLEKWSKVGLQVFESNVPIAGTVEYLAGYYMLQAAASFLPVMALAPQEHERVLDLSAAPGGKTTYLAQLMKNTGVIFANDVSEPRCKSLNANLQRLGIINCIVTNYDGRNYGAVMHHFDRVLLDAPCTGTGIISRDKSIKTSKHYEDVQRASQLQRELLLSAIDACKVHGVIVYSTCSFLVEEDEAIVDFALRRRQVEVVEMGLPFGRPGFTKYRHHRYAENLHLSRRYFPHVHNMDGFYVCKLRKLGDEKLDVPTENSNENNNHESNNKKEEKNKAHLATSNKATTKYETDTTLGKKRPRSNVEETNTNNNNSTSEHINNSNTNKQLVKHATKDQRVSVPPTDKPSERSTNTSSSPKSKTATQTKKNKKEDRELGDAIKT